MRRTPAVLAHNHYFNQNIHFSYIPQMHTPNIYTILSHNHFSQIQVTLFAAPVLADAVYHSTLISPAQRSPQLTQFDDFLVVHHTLLTVLCCWSNCLSAPTMSTTCSSQLPSLICPCASYTASIVSRRLPQLHTQFMDTSCLRQSPQHAHSSSQSTSTIFLYVLSAESVHQIFDV